MATTSLEKTVKTGTKLVTVEFVSTLKLICGPSSRKAAIHNNKSLVKLPLLLDASWHPKPHVREYTNLGCSHPAPTSAPVG